MKKVYTTLDQAFMFARNQHGGVKNWGLESAGMNANPDEDEITFNNTVRARFWEIMSPYFNTLIKCSKISTGECGSYERYSLDGTHFGNFHPYIVLSDGTSIVGTTVADGSCNAVYGNNKQLQNVCGELMVDLNGANPPNATGKDVFIFYYTKYGVIPVGTEMETHFTFENYCNIGKTAIQNGYGCAGCIGRTCRNRCGSGRYCRLHRYDGADGRDLNTKSPRYGGAFVDWKRYGQGANRVSVE